MILALSLAIAGKAAAGDSLPDFDSLWNYNNPEGTRARFEEILPQAESSGDASYHLQLLTQIARAYGLQGEFDQAHKVLDRVESSLNGDLKLVRVRYLLERGRTFNSSGRKDTARVLFEEAFDLAQSIEATFFAVDAAHMVALAATAPEQRREWNLRGIRIAEKSADPRVRHWRGSIYNNLGWDYHDAGEYDSALAMFERAVDARIEEGNEELLDIARWCQARALRSVGQVEQALEIQMTLMKKHQEAGKKDGFVFEELGELLLIKADTARAVPYFRLAYDELSKVEWLVKSDPERLERIRRLAEQEP